MSILYKQERVGKEGRSFTLYKFRTMKPNADRITQFAVPEVYTRWGHTLRRYKLDELPQIWNVIKGEMQIVGPRPDAQNIYDVMPDFAKKKILSVKPGLTSLSSIFFYDEEKLLQEVGEEKYKNYFTIIKPAKILLDSFYIENKCWILDLAIVYLTIKKILNAIFNRKRTQHGP